MKHCLFVFIFTVSVIIPVFSLTASVTAQINPASVDRFADRSGYNFTEINGNRDIETIDFSHESVYPAENVIYDTLWIVDDGLTDAGNGCAISGKSIFGSMRDMGLVDDFEISTGTTELSRVVTDYVSSNGGAYRPATDVMIEVFNDLGGKPSETPAFQVMGTTYICEEINVSWWGPGTRIRVDVEPGIIQINDGLWWVSVVPVDTTVSGDWYYALRRYGKPILADTHGRDGGTDHGSLYGGPYTGGYLINNWTSMETMGYKQGITSMRIESAGESSTSVAFRQVDIFIDNAEIANSRWGSVELEFVGTQQIKYFNLNVNGNWQIVNMPVLSVDGVGMLQSMTYNFDLGVSSGTDVTELLYGYALTDTVMNNIPVMTDVAGVSSRSVIMASGIHGSDNGGWEPLSLPAVLRGGEVITFAVNADVNNQDCGIGECVPAAASVGMRYLNEIYNLNIPNRYSSIRVMKRATDWRDMISGCKANWATVKSQFMQQHEYPITTVEYDMIKTENRQTGVLAAINALKNDCSVEISALNLKKDAAGKRPGHTAVVVGLARLSNGMIAIDVKHDTNQQYDQGVGLKTETILYDPVSGELSHGWGFNDRGLIHFVIECEK